MLVTQMVGSTVQVACTGKTLSSSAQKIYDVLRQVGELVKAHRGYHAKTSQVTFFCPLEVVAMVAGVSRRTLYYKLPELLERRLVAQRGHFCTLNGQTRQDGSLWAVRLSGEGSINVDYDYLKKSYRNLGADIAVGKTAYAIAQSKLQEDKPVGIESVLSFAITTDSPSITDDRAMKNLGQIEEILDLAYVPKEGINKAVNSVSKTIAREFGAVETSLMFYRWLIWNLLRLERQGNDRFYAVFLLIQRVKVDKNEGACNNASALFTYRLKSSPIWDELRSVRHSRIGLPPS